MLGKLLSSYSYSMTSITKDSATPSPHLPLWCHCLPPRNAEASVILEANDNKESESGTQAIWHKVWRQSKQTVCVLNHFFIVNLHSVPLQGPVYANPQLPEKLKHRCSIICGLYGGISAPPVPSHGYLEAISQIKDLFDTQCVVAPSSLCLHLPCEIQLTLNNVGLNYTGPLTCKFFSVNTC